MQPTEEKAGTAEGGHPERRLAFLGAAGAVAAACAVVFYFQAVANFGSNIPVEDDVEFLRFLLERGGADAQGWFAFHNEHRPATSRAIFAAVTWAQGHLDLRSVMFVGFAALVGLTLIVCSWLPRTRWPHRLAAAAPIFVLLFSLQHWQAATWATGAAQHYPMLLCGLGSIALLSRPTPVRTPLAGLLAAAALFNLGAGLFVFVVGLGMLLQGRAWKSAAGFGVWAAICIGFYFEGYAPPEHHPSPFAAFGDPVAATDYAFSLLGAGFSFDDMQVGWLARFAGFGLALAFAVLIRDGLPRNDTPLFAALCLVFFTLASVTATRFGFGLDQAFDSRYRVHSHLFVVLLWVALVRRWGTSPG